MVKKDAIIAEKDAIIIQKTTALEDIDDMIGKLEAVIVSLAGPEQIDELKAHLSLMEAEKELERRKARHFRLQVTAANAAKQTLQH